MHGRKPFTQCDGAILTQDEVADIVGISSQRVGQLTRDGLNRLASALLDTPTLGPLFRQYLDATDEQDYREIAAALAAHSVDMVRARSDEPTVTVERVLASSDWMAWTWSTADAVVADCPLRAAYEAIRRRRMLNAEDATP